MPVMPSRPVTDELPAAFATYAFYGVEVEYRGRKESAGVCPFCNSEDAFSVNVNGAYRCLRASCNAKGGPRSFLQSFYDHCFDATKPAAYKKLIGERTLEFVDTPVLWGLAWNPRTGYWMVPGYEWVSDKLQLVSLYQYVKTKERSTLMLPSGGHHCLLGLNMWDANKDDVYIAEGPWDAMRLWEVFKGTKLLDGKPVPTSSADSSLAALSNVIGVPGATVLNEDWTPMFSSKRVALLYDNDHPKKNPTTGLMSEPGGYVGMRFAASRITKATQEIGYLSWGAEGYDPSLDSGYDLRNLFGNRDTLVENLQSLLDRIEPIPADWMSAKSNGVFQDIIVCRPCTSYRDLICSWRKALKWTDGLDHALSVMLATVASTKSVGDQLWVKIIGPASSGKTTLADAITVAKEYVLAKSTIRGFHSGYRVRPTDPTEDNSLIPLISGKTLITKDGDTLLQSPNLSQILAEARDLYDGSSRTHYRQGAGRDYENVRMTWILCGTESLRTIDDSELGQRFLDCVVMESAWLLTKEGLSLEDEILWRQVNKAVDQVAVESDGKAGSCHSPALIECYSLTGGYVNHLRKTAGTGIAQIEFSDSAKRECVELGKFIAYMRARPSKRQSESQERELAARLVGQIARLSRCLAFVMNATNVVARDEVMQRVRHVALDTSRGLVLDVCGILNRYGTMGSEFRGIQLHATCPDTELRKILHFLKAIGVTQRVVTTNRSAWALTPGVQKLYQSVVHAASETA